MSTQDVSIRLVKRKSVQPPVVEKSQKAATINAQNYVTAKPLTNEAYLNVQNIDILDVIVNLVDGYVIKDGNTVPFNAIPALGIAKLGIMKLGLGG